MDERKMVLIGSALAIALAAAIELTVAVLSPGCPIGAPEGPTIGGVITISGCPKHSRRAGP